ncbi:putative sodium/potassium/calcium exchanger [Nocardiopsis xinjiangensis]|uniref:hypothetical protein n=1 Tax=Nocardiopsis xinjiangensis TaxID=124285 RepID=UPI0003656CB5|nr:hypothetical protein [Nocardiopsis xinjiangensis]
MVFMGQRWPVLTGRAAHGSHALVRLLLLSGIVAVAWLAGGFGVAHSDTAPEPEGLVDNVRELGENTEHAGQAVGDEVRDSRLSDTAARTTETTGRVTEETASRALSLPADTLEGAGAAEPFEGATDVTDSLGESGVAGTLEGTGDETGRVVGETSRAVGDTARGAGELVTGLARTGQDVVEPTDGSLRGETALVDSLTEGLTESARSVDGATAADEARETDDGELSTEPEGDGRGDGQEEETSASGNAALAIAQTEDPEWRAAAEEAAHHVSSDGDGEVERIHLIAGGGQHSVGTDATGASSPTFSAPGAAGFLTARADHTAPRAQRVVLPGDPTVVVRDAADDPSYTPD